MTDPRFFTTSILSVRRGLVLRGGGRERVPLRVRVGHFHHPELGHTLIDTGYASRVVSGGDDWTLGLYRLLLRPSLVNDAPLEAGLARLGLAIGDIETVIVTHFHADHIGGLRDLPHARIVCSRTAWESCRRAGRINNARAGVFETLLPDDLESRLLFVEDMQTPTGTPGEFDVTSDGAVRAVALPGHLDGQIGLRFSYTTPPFLYAADATWSLDALKEDRLPGFPIDRVHHDRAAARSSVETVRGFMAAGDDVLLCHDWHIHPRDLDGDVTG